MEDFKMAYNGSENQLLMQSNSLELVDPLSLEILKELEEHPDFDFNGSLSILEQLKALEMNDRHPELAIFRKVLQVLDNYFVPFILLLGVAGNTLSFIVFVATHLKRSSCHIYLASLAIADNIFLCCVFISWGENIGISMYNHHGWCQILMFLTHVSSFLSVWYVVSFTVERWLVTCHPLKQNRLYTTKNAKVVVICLAAFALFAYSYTLFTSGILSVQVATVCAPLPQFYKMVSTIDNIDTLMTLLIPTFIIIGCNIHITYLVCTFYKSYGQDPKRNGVQKWDFSHPSGNTHRKSNYAEVSRNSNNNGILIHNPSQTQHSKSRGAAGMTRTSHMRATRMLLIVSTVFIVCNLPNHAARTYSFVMAIVDESYSQSAIFILVQKLFQILNYINFSMNFFLYSLSGRSFRTGLKRLKMKIKRKMKTVTCLRRGRESSDNTPPLVSNKTEMQMKMYL